MDSVLGRPVLRLSMPHFSVLQMPAPHSEQWWPRIWLLSLPRSPSVTLLTKIHFMFMSVTVIGCGTASRVPFSQMICISSSDNSRYAGQAAAPSTTPQRPATAAAHAATPNRPAANPNITTLSPARTAVGAITRYFMPNISTRQSDPDIRPAGQLIVRFGRGLNEVGAAGQADYAPE